MLRVKQDTHLYMEFCFLPAGFSITKTTGGPSGSAAAACFTRCTMRRKALTVLRDSAISSAVVTWARASECTVQGGPPTSSTASQPCSRSVLKAVIVSSTSGFPTKACSPER